MNALLVWIVLTPLVLLWASRTHDLYGIRIFVGTYIGGAIWAVLAYQHYTVALLDLVAAALLFGVYRLRREVSA